MVVQRLMAAADEVFALIEQAFAEHEEEVRLKWTKHLEPKEPLPKQDVPTRLAPPEAHLEHTKAVQTQCEPPVFVPFGESPVFVPFGPSKSEVNVNKPASLQQDPCDQPTEPRGVQGPPGSSKLPPGRQETPPSCSDTDDSEDWETSADKRTQNDAQESDTANNTDSQRDGLSRKRRKRRKRQHEANHGDVVVKKEREEQLETCMQLGAITNVVSLEEAAQTSANTASTSWMNLLTQQLQTTDPVVLMHEMLAKQDVLLQQQEQIFSLLSNSQLQVPECALNYKDLPIRDEQTLSGIEARLQDEDYRTKLVLTSHLRIPLAHSPSQVPAVLIMTQGSITVTSCSDSQPGNVLTRIFTYI